MSQAEEIAEKEASGTWMQGGWGLAKTFWLTYLLPPFIIGLLIGDSPGAAGVVLALAVLVYSILARIATWRASRHAGGFNRFWPGLTNIVLSLHAVIAAGLSRRSGRRRGEVRHTSRRIDQWGASIRIRSAPKAATWTSSSPGSW